MEINEDKPERKHRRFTIGLAMDELEEIQIAFNHMLSISFYTDTQKDRVRKLRDALTGYLHY